MTNEMTAKHTPKTGMVIEGINWINGPKKLTAETEWDKAEFRYEASYQSGLSRACNVIVTGEKEYNRGGSYWVTCRIEFPEDGAETTSIRGWLKVA